MALNSDFKVKDSLYVGNSACFVSQTNTPVILSAGSSLFDIFLQEGEVSASCTLSPGQGITSTGSFDGTADRTFTVCTNVLSAATYVATNGSNLIDTVATGNAQGKVAVTNIGNTTSQISIAGLGATDSPGFGGVTADNIRIGITDAQTIDTSSGVLKLNSSGGTTCIDDNVCITTGALDVVDGQILSGGNDLFTLFSEGDITGVTATGGLSGGGTNGNINIGINAATAAGFSCQGTVTSAGITPGNLIDVSGSPITTSGNITVNVDLSELSTSTSDGDGDFFAVVDSSNAQRKLTKGNINISGFNNDSNFTDCEGTFNTAGAGLSASGGTVGINATTAAGFSCQGIVTGIDAGTAITVADNGTATPTVGVTSACNTNWNAAYTWCNTNGNNVYDTANSPSQGTLTLTDVGGSPDTIDLGVQRGDSPTFVGLSAITLCGDGSNITGVTATPIFPTTAVTNIASGDKFFLNDGANKHVTYLNLLTDLAGTGISVEGNDSLRIGANLGSNTIPYWSGSDLEDSIITRSASKITIGGDHLVTGDSTVYGNLSVTGDFTCIETTVTTTSALSVTNTGTGPALFVKQGGTQPIAHFIDSNGDDIVFADDGAIGIGTFTPGEKLDVVGNIRAIGNITASNNLTIDGNAEFGDSGSGIGTVTLHGNALCIPQIGSGTQSGNAVLVKDNNNCVKLDGVDPKIFTSTTLVDGSGTCGKVAKYTSTGDTIGDSTITDTGSLVTIGSNLKVDGNKSLDIYATGGSIYSSEKTFTASVGTGGTTVATFAKSGFESAKFTVTLIKGVNKTAFEVLVVYNGSTSTGTVYGIVDAQAASQLDTIDVSNSGTTIDLIITSASATTTAIIQGKALY